MIQRVTLIRKHGSENWSVALQPSVPMREHRRFIKRYRIARRDPDIAEIMLCEPLRSFPLARAEKPKQEPPPPQTVVQTVTAAAKRVRASASTMASRLRG